MAIINTAKIFNNFNGFRTTKFVSKYNKDISETFTSEILAIRSTLENDINQFYSIRELDHLLIIKNHSLTLSFPDVCAYCKKYYKITCA